MQGKENAERNGREHWEGAKKSQMCERRGCLQRSKAKMRDRNETMPRTSTPWLVLPCGEVRGRKLRSSEQREKKLQWKAWLAPIKNACRQGDCHLN